MDIYTDNSLILPDDAGKLIVPQGTIILNSAVPGTIPHVGFLVRGDHLDASVPYVIYHSDGTADEALAEMGAAVCQLYPDLVKIITTEIEKGELVTPATYTDHRAGTHYLVQALTAGIPVPYLPGVLWETS